MNKEYLELLQKRIGSTSVGASTARRMGPPGTIQSARQFLQSLDISRFAKRSQKNFLAVLDTVTLELKRALPVKARNWGSARKFLNIFLRSCVYNKYVCEAYRLETIEPWLEVPIDSHVAKGLKGEGSRGQLPRWKTVISLTHEENALYQDFASFVAAKFGVLRVHLDLKYWRRDS